MKLPLIIGFIAALVHVLTGPDHLAAVTPLVLEKKSKSWKIGLGWGLGHVLGMLLIGLLFYLFKNQIPVESVSKNSEKFVGFMLIGIGFWALYRTHQSKKKLAYPHTHTQENDSYTHIHKTKGEHQHKKIKKHNAVLSFFIGIIHGFAGISHFILMLPVLGYKSATDSIQYMLGFALGIISAMVIYALIIDKLSDTTQKNHSKTIIWLQYTGALFAFAIGIYWIYVN